MGEVEAAGFVRLACTHMCCTVHYIGKLSCSIELTEKWALEAGLRLHLHFKPKHVCLRIIQGPLSGGGLPSYLWKEPHKPKSKTTVLWAELASQLFPADVPMLGPWYKSAWSGKEKRKVQPWEAQSREETPLGTAADCLPFLSWLVLTGVNACCDLWFCLLLPVVPWGDSEDTHPGLFPLRMPITLKGLFRWDFCWRLNLWLDSFTTYLSTTDLLFYFDLLDT